MYGVQYGVHGGTQTAGPSPSASEMSEMREMLKCQQKQLNQLVGSIAQLQNFHRYSRPSCSGPVVCWRCHQRGHLRVSVIERVFHVVLLPLSFFHNPI